MKRCCFDISSRDPSTSRRGCVINSDAGASMKRGTWDLVAGPRVVAASAEERSPCRPGSVCVIVRRRSRAAREEKKAVVLRDDETSWFSTMKLRASPTSRRER